MSKPLVSVVIPVYNGLPFLQEAVASVLSQDYEPVQLVLVDGGSTDGSREWIDAFEHPGVIKDYLPSGTPAAGTWTRATELAEGSFVKLLCQDDLLFPAAISLQVDDLLAHQDAGMSIAQRDIISADGTVVARARGCGGLEDGIVNGIHALEVGCWQGANIFGEPLAVLFRGDLMRQSLPWEDDQPFLLDMFFYAKVLQRSNLVVRRVSIGAFRISSSSWSTRLRSHQRRQFHAWQRHVERDISPQPWYRVVQSRLNTERTTLIRRAAYSWLKVRNQFYR